MLYRVWMEKLFGRKNFHLKGDCYLVFFFFLACVYAHARACMQAGQITALSILWFDFFSPTCLQLRDCSSFSA